MGKTPIGDKTPGIDPAMCFHELEYGDKAEEGEESETIVINNSRLAVLKKKFVKRKFPCIYKLDHEGPTVVSIICDLTSRVFDHLEIPLHMEVDKRVVYMQTILRGSAINKYKTVLLECKQLVKNLMGDKWTLGDLKALFIENF